jgi:hypothetical protein
MNDSASIFVLYKRSLAFIEQEVRSKGTAKEAFEAVLTIS